MINQNVGEESKEQAMIMEARKAEFLTKELFLVDSTWNPDSAISVYVYIEYGVGFGNRIWYILNTEGNYYTVFGAMSDLMVNLEGHAFDNRWLDLTPIEMQQIDPTVKGL